MESKIDFLEELLMGQDAIDNGDDKEAFIECVLIALFYLIKEEQP